MSNPAADPAEWPRARWLGAFSIAFFAQIGLLFLVSERQTVVPHRTHPGFALHLFPDLPTGSAIAERISLDDPTLFALPNTRGFSGSAWLKASPLVHRSQDWSEPVPWLSQSPDVLGAAFREFARTNVVGPRLFADRPPPPIREADAPPIPLRARSAYYLEGALAGRGLRESFEVPSMTNTDLLTNTVIEVSVDRRGFVFSASLLVGSGSDQADQDALSLARALRFKPANPADRRRGSRDLTPFAWGKVIFEWHSVEGTATNSPAIIPPS